MPKSPSPAQALLQQVSTAIAASALLVFFLDELGPIVYNKAVADVQERLQARVIEVGQEIHEDEFQYWRKMDSARKAK